MDSVAVDSIYEDSASEAIFWLQKSAEQDFTPAFAQLAELYLLNEHADNCFKYALKAAKAGDAKEQGLVSMLYYYGCGTDRDAKESRYWAHLAATQNDANGIAMLGLAFSDEGNYEAAISRLEQAAELDNNMARLVLADMYENGKGVEKNIDRAKNYLKDAAGNGYNNAQMRMLYLYYTKMATSDEPCNKIKALKWIRKAAENVNADATNLRKTM